MIARNTAIANLTKALEAVNLKYDDNITFKRQPERISNTSVRFTLTVKSSKKSGGRKGFTGRYIAAACWHVHGNFFEELFKINNDSIIKAGTKTIDSNSGNWEDWNIGSMVNPMYYSEACEC